MKTLLFTLLCLGAALAQVSVPVIFEGNKWPELKTLDGKAFKDVKFSRVDRETVRFVHADGIATLKVSDLSLPPGTEIMVRSEEQRGAEVMDARMAALTREANICMQNTGRDLHEIQSAIRCREWCLANPEGGVVQTADGPREFTKAKRDEQLQVALAILSTKRADAPLYHAAISTPPVAGGALSTRPATPVGRSANDPARVAEQMARQQRAGGGGGAPMVIESTIDGKFEGFEHGRLFKLLNGQIWEQTDFRIHYHYAYSPRVRLFLEAGGYQMKVEGLDETIQVRMR